MKTKAWAIVWKNQGDSLDEKILHGNYEGAWQYFIYINRSEAARARKYKMKDDETKTFMKLIKII